ncbi:MAG: undecaprenyl-phosphate glucose phosphotransferase [Rhodocyclaceae bacterium]|nr:MAG: undecaprenyl-phosphate glucose phosphotransferase [Rhodocyclaceae bacterium]
MASPHAHASPVPHLAHTATAPSQRKLAGRIGDDGSFWLQWLAGIASVAATLAILTLYKTSALGTDYRILLLVSSALSLPIYALYTVYHAPHGALEGLARLTLAWLTLLGCLLGLAFVTKTTGQYSREILGLWALLGLSAQSACYLALRPWLRAQHAPDAAGVRVAIIGQGTLAHELARRLRDTRPEFLAGLITTGARPNRAHGATAPVLGSLDQLRDILATQRIQRLYVALPHQIDIKPLYLQLLDANVDVVWVPDLHDLLLLNHAVTDIGGLPAIKLNESPLTAYPNAARLKAAMDRSLALLGLVALSPLLVLVAVLVKLSSPGPVLFRQQRHGWNGQVIEVWKFRSMRMHDDAQVRQATRNDSRITPIGRFIRRTSIDELPQLFNVLQGSMSLVGPRPHAVAHNDFYANKIQAYMARHRIKPGITGLAQISGYRGETDTLDKMQKRVELDLAYINNWSLWLDIKILIKTPFTLFGKHIY